MGTYNSAVITNGGQSMIAQAVAGASLEFTTIKTSNYAYPAGTNLATLTTINGIKQSKDITSATVYNSRVIKISAAVDNTGISTAYTINTIGIYAKVGSAAEALFAVVTASSADTMPAYDNKPYSYIYDVNLTMQNAANVTVTVNAAGLVNVSDLNAAKVEIQGEIADLKSHLDKCSDIISTNMMGVDVQQNLYPGSADWSGTWKNSDAIHIGVSSVKFMGYPTVYSSYSWRRYAKDIPVEVGKTYTFEGWVKQTVAGDVAAYAISKGFTTNPATVSTAFKTYTNQPADTWIKVSLTFTCSVAGNVSPFVLGRDGAFYVAKYILVEGDSVFGLTDALNSKAAKQDISGIGDYKKYDFVLRTSLGEYWNNVINETITAGTKVKLIFDSYSGQYLNYVRVDGIKSDDTFTVLGKITNPAYGNEAEFITAENYVALRIQFYRITNEGNVTASVYLTTTKELGIANELLSMNKSKVFYISKNGGGDFTKFVDGVNEACKHMDSIVYVDSGEYDIIEEFGAEYMAGVTSSKNWGIELKNRVHIIGAAKTVIKAINEDTEDNTNFANIKEYFSVFNAGAYGFTIENLTIIDDSIRYSVHDDRGCSGLVPYRNHYINCSMKHTNGMYTDCIGAGIGEDGYIEIRGCYFDGDITRNGSPVTRYVYWHGNNNASVTNAKGRIYVTDNYFCNTGTFKLTRYGNSTTKTIAYVSNNSFGSQPEITNGASPSPIIDNMEMVQWNNEIRT